MVFGSVGAFAGKDAYSTMLNSSNYMNRFFLKARFANGILGPNVGVCITFSSPNTSSIGSKTVLLAALVGPTIRGIRRVLPGPLSRTAARHAANHFELMVSWLR
jgi:hypothetical protein